MSVIDLHSRKKKGTVARRSAVVLPTGTPPSERGTLMMHVEERDERLEVGGWVLAIPVYIGQPGLEAALFASTQSFQCTQTIFLGGVMLSLSPALLHEVGAALRQFVESASAS